MDQGRRQFLRAGGASVIGVLIGGACSGDDAEPGRDAGSSDPASSTTTTTSAPAAAPAVIDDLTLARTAASLEALAVATYGTVQSIGLVDDQRVHDFARLHGEHHQTHLDELNRVLAQAGAKPYSTPNAIVQRVLVDPVLTKPRLAEADLVTLARDLEATLAQMYTYAAGLFTTPALRSTSMTIGGVEARHAASIGRALMNVAPAALFPASFAAADSPLPADALISG